MRTKPSTYGPGSYKLSITKLFTGPCNNSVTIVIYNDIISANPEFERVKKDFKYIKIKGIVITFEPRNLPLATNQTPLYMILNYDGTTTKNLRLQDSAKIVPSFLIKPKIFKYNIPKLNTYSGILNGWFNMNDLAYISDIMLQLHSPGNSTDWFMKIDVVAILRGPTNETEEENKFIMNFSEFKNKKDLEEGGRQSIKENENEIENEEDKEEDKKEKILKEKYKELKKNFKEKIKEINEKYEKEIEIFKRNFEEKLKVNIEESIEENKENYEILSETKENN